VALRIGVNEREAENGFVDNGDSAVRWRGEVLLQKPSAESRSESYEAS